MSALLTCQGLAAPSAFPETAVHFSVGSGRYPSVSVGAEYLIPPALVEYFDASADLRLVAATNGVFSARLSGTALLFPAVGTGLPLALGFGTDIGVSNGAASFHLGFIMGSDLLFVSDLPVTVSTYLAPGYSSGAGFSLAWALQLRYYVDRFAVELASTDLMLVGVGVRYLF